MDPRYKKLADVITHYSINLKKNEKVLLDLSDVPELMAIALIRSVRSCGAIPFVDTHSGLIQKELILNLDLGQYEIQSGWKLKQMEDMDAYVGIRGSPNIFEFSDIKSSNIIAVSNAMKPVLERRVNNTKWVVLRWPTSSMAQQALMSSSNFEDHFFKVCSFDYSKMELGMEALKDLMNNTDIVELKGHNLDLRFSIKGIDSVSCGGHYNLPDGEVFTAPIKDSVEGTIQFNTPTIYRGISFDNIKLEFKEGKIIGAESNNTKELNSILDSDPGARYIGEFAIGFNPLINEPIRDILFDEKISGSFHFTPGQAYEEADNGNRSQVHWDMVHIQRPEYGGGSIYFDNKLIRKDGKFLEESLLSLNPENLLT